MADDCSQNTDPLKLVREGTSQDDRVSAALAPVSVPVDARTVADDIVFAQGYAHLLKRYDANNKDKGDDWAAFFGTDVAVPLAIASVEDVNAYKVRIRSWFDFLNDLRNAGGPPALEDHLGYLFAAIGALAGALDDLGQHLPDSVALKGVLSNLIDTQLASAFERFIAYYKGAAALGVVNDVAPVPAMQILRRTADSFAKVLSTGLSGNWSRGKTWADYVAGIVADTSVYGQGGGALPDPFGRINHCATHPLFRSVFDAFLKVFMRVVNDAQAGLDDTLSHSSGHPPHYALYVAFLRLLTHARTAGNTLAQRHLDFHYGTVLGLKPKPAQPGGVHLLAELARQADRYDFAPGQLFRAGKDATGKAAFFANRADLVANKATVAALKTVYRHGREPVADRLQDRDRLFASPVANSDDGQGAPLTSVDRSWQPFFNKVYVDGALSAIRMPPAQVGFAIASHHLLAAEGTRVFVVTLTTGAVIPTASGDKFTADVTCLLTTAKGWLAKRPAAFVRVGIQALELTVELSGADDAVVPYSATVHGYNFDTDLPLLLVTLSQDEARHYAYPRLQDMTVAKIRLDVHVSGVRTLAVANDFGPVDLSKPFQPFGASPVAGSSLVVGSKEIFQKQLARMEFDLKWLVPPAVYASAHGMPNAGIDFLGAGTWFPSGTSISIAPTSGDTTTFLVDGHVDDTVLDAPDFGPAEAFGTQSRHGYVRLKLDNDIGQDNYQTDLIAYLRKDPDSAGYPGKPPQGPVAAALTAGYAATTTLALDTASEAAFKSRIGRFFHLAPFGTAEQHPYLSGGSAVPLLPQFRFSRGGAMFTSEAECYIGIAGLVPPQNLSLLFQVVDGTANPLAQKPAQHIDWNYLAHDQWVDFPENGVADATEALLNSGIVTFAVPSDATSDNRLLPSGWFWIRAAVSEASDAVCRLQCVAAQALEAVFSDQGNAPDFSATPLPAGTITQLATPASAIKSITQPYPSFGGRGAERPQAFYQRVSERLRHKDRAIDLWDYERLILDAFPQIYKVKCLNHTCYEPADSDSTGPCSGGIYRELAPGHVTIVALASLTSQQHRDPLKPYTSLRLLNEIQSFLQRRCGCFAQLHVKNPQFESVRAEFKLKLRDGYDQAYYTTQLQQAITRFLSPWAFDGIGVPSFGGKIYKSTLIQFVEGQPYVDYVTDFQLFRDIPCQPAGTVDLDEIAGSRAVSVLVSAGRHGISPIGAAPDSALAETCGCGP
ncbi:hypothetical protein DID96_25460 [Burkholderia sp. Bp8963]|uniref:baseplate J/gp47 family protein n=1 Tax=Burkholderia sp. Bp8963 TaxID=2184547 RepID=UPI000F5A4838|nr:baseplate J/gp47 family protein [Burkholderia sp. Bp8963]RQS65777.1 hypothetical protein DID96_25460 [Burkholderia sp. Bp8963]